MVVKKGDSDPMKRTATLFLFALLLSAIGATALPSQPAAQCTAAQPSFLSGAQELLAPSALDGAIPASPTCNQACTNQRDACRATCNGSTRCLNGCYNQWGACLCLCSPIYC
jgi:hypothetical protein